MACQEINVLAVAVQAGINVFLESAPGEAKSAIIRALAKAIQEKRKADFPCVVVNLAQIGAEELYGAQVPHHESKMMVPYAMGPIQPLLHAKTGIFFGDERSSIQSPAVRGAFLTVESERRFGGVEIPDVVVVTAGNPIDYATGGGVEMGPAEVTRTLTLPWRLPKRDWHDHLIGGAGVLTTFPFLPEDWKRQAHAMNLLIIKFTQVHDQYKNEIQSWCDNPENANRPFRGGSFACPRTWEWAGRMLGALKACGFDLTSDEAALALKGLVGKNAADQFIDWVRKEDLPDPEIFLADPELADPEGKKYAMPKAPHKFGMAVDMVAMAACDPSYDAKERLSRFYAAWKVIDFCLKSKTPDLVMSAGNLLCGKAPEGYKTVATMGKILQMRRAAGVSAGP